MVTTVIIPSVRKIESPENRLNTFEKIEGRFAIQAKVTTVITALTGFYMLYELDAWGRFLDYRFWWIHAMTLIWLIFTIILFVLEPYVLHKIIRKRIKKNPDRIFRRIHRMHWILLILSLITIAGAVAGSHGLFFI